MFSLLLALVMWGTHGNPLHTNGGTDGEKSAYDSLAFAGREGHGANLDAPADPSQPYPARPEWYFLFLFQLLKYFEGPDSLIGTVVIPNGVAALLVLLPLLGYGRMRPVGHMLGICAVVCILAGAGALTCLAIADDMEDAVNRYLVTQLALVAVPVIAGWVLLLLFFMAVLPRGAMRSVVYAGGLAVLALLLLGAGSALYGA